jgi:hypothetical protein
MRFRTDIAAEAAAGNPVTIDSGPAA